LFAVGQVDILRKTEMCQMTHARITTLLFAVIGLGTISAGQAYAQANAQAGCQVQVTGAVNASWTGEWRDSDDAESGYVGAASDYWLTDEDMKEVAESMEGPGSKARKLTMLMRRVPRIAILLLNCATPEGHVFIRPANKSVYDDVPRKAQPYKIAAEKTATPGQFVASSLRVGRSYYQVTDGRLDLKKFNFDGAAGTFTLKASLAGTADKGKDITVQGTFNFPCTGLGSRCRVR
jgi:hypothetical protein